MPPWCFSWCCHGQGQGFDYRLHGENRKALHRSWTLRSTGSTPDSLHHPCSGKRSVDATERLLERYRPPSLQCPIPTHVVYTPCTVYMYVHDMYVHAFHISCMYRIHTCRLSNMTCHVLQRYLSIYYYLCSMITLSMHHHASWSDV